MDSVQRAWDALMDEVDDWPAYRKSAVVRFAIAVLEATEGVMLLDLAASDEKYGDTNFDALRERIEKLS